MVTLLRRNTGDSRNSCTYHAAFVSAAHRQAHSPCPVTETHPDTDSPTAHPHPYRSQAEPVLHHTEPYTHPDAVSVEDQQSIHQPSSHRQRADSWAYNTCRTHALVASGRAVPPHGPLHGPPPKLSKLALVSNTSARACAREGGPANRREDDGAFGVVGHGQDCWGTSAWSIWATDVRRNASVNNDGL